MVRPLLEGEEKGYWAIAYTVPAIFLIVLIVRSPGIKDEYAFIVVLIRYLWLAYLPGAV